ncbi:MAG: hypothetical protein FJY88_04700 [Candidatus Eisenbacteria bacterium]|nr:hypothetical protein [Candidatus Eisenbacteria bacterium]
MSSHRHRWVMTDLRAGYLVAEACYECGARSSFFSGEPVPPVDEYKEGRHYWIYQGSFQAVKFHLKCTECGRQVDLDDMTALMMSTCDDPACPVGRLVTKQSPGSWVYVALCGNSKHPSGRCVSPEGIEALNEYFNQDAEASARRITVVPCSMCSSVDTCEGTIIADTGLTEIY